MVPEDIKIPGYTVEKRLGRGGMASVFLAHQKALNRKVALKVMSNQLGDDSVWAKRFIQEAQVIAQLTHPNVVPVYDVGTHDGKFYIAMENLEGGSLKEKMVGGIALPEVLKIVVGVAAGLDYAGEKGFIHRDIKPDNIMFRDDGSPVILDFGIVKQMDQGPSQMTQTGVIVGTTSYMSPEQAQGRELDQRSDIYSLGIMFYELLTGKPPFKGDSDMATLLMHIREPVPPIKGPLSVFMPVIEKALAKDSFHRYTRAREMIDHIQSLEPRIKTAIQKMQLGNASDPTMVKKKPSQPGDATIVSSRGNDDATVVMARDGDDATQVMGTSGAYAQVTGEEELTQVLSSAKATIRDFSVESRARKARRAKQVLFSALIVAAVATSYVGYQQLYVVPKERAAAEAKIRAAAEKTQRKIDALLNEGKIARQDMLPTELDKVDNVVAIYRQVLKLDPENEEADFHLEKLGERFIEMSKSATRRKDMQKAITYRDYAESLVPNHIELSALRSAIKNLRGEELDKEFINEEITTLIEVAEEDINKSDGFSDSAYTKLQQVLRLQPGNEKAQTLLSSMLERVYTQTQADIKSGRLNQASDNIELLQRYYGDPVKVAELDAELQVISARTSKAQQIRSLKADVERLLREKRTIAVNDKLRANYKKILALDPADNEARQGLSATADYEAQLARVAIEERDYDRAENHIRTIETQTPRYNGLVSLKTQLATSKQADKKAEAILFEAEKNMMTEADHENKRELLKQAYEQIERARFVDANHPQIPSAMADLESEYVALIRQALEDDNSTLAEAYFSDTDQKEWPTDRLFELKQLSQKKKPKRVITGGF